MFWQCREHLRGAASIPYCQDGILSHQLGELGRSQHVTQQNSHGRNNLSSDCRVMIVLLVRDKQPAPTTPKWLSAPTVDLRRTSGLDGEILSWVSPTGPFLLKHEEEDCFYSYSEPSGVSSSVRPTPRAGSHNSEVDQSRPNLVLLCNILPHRTNHAQIVPTETQQSATPSTPPLRCLITPDWVKRSTRSMLTHDCAPAVISHTTAVDWGAGEGGRDKGGGRRRGSSAAAPLSPARN